MAAALNVRGQVRIFPGPGGWHYVSVPKKYSTLFADSADRGLVPITVSLGETTWDTSLLPMGDGTHFIALKAAVRKKESIELGDRVSLSFVPRL